MSKNKQPSNIALFSKHKTFKRIFLERSIIVLTIIILLYTLCITVFAINEKNKIVPRFNSQTKNVIQSVETGFNEKEPTYANNYIHHPLLQNFPAYGFPMLIFDGDTGEILYNCDEHLFIIRKVGDNSAVVYLYPTSNLPNWDGYYQKLSQYKLPLMEFDYNITFDYYYTNGTDFIPGPLTIKTIYYTPHSISSEKDFFSNPLFTYQIEGPSSVPDGFIKTEFNPDDFLGTGASLLGYHPDKPPYTPLFKSDINTSYNYLMSVYEMITASLPEESSTEYNDILSETIFTLDMYSINTLNTKDDSNIVLLSAISYDFFNVYKTELIIIGIFVLILGLIVAFLLARTSYAHIKTQYDMDDYRKTLINTMAHDLKSPLMAISGYAENLYDNVHSEKREHYSNAILDNVKHINKIIESILSLNKTESITNLKKENMSALNLINDCIKKYELIIEEKNLLLKISGDTTLYADFILMQEAIDNLVGNALKYASSGTTIEILLEDAKLTFKNCYNGNINFDANKLLEPFVTGDTSRGREKSGTGLGLAIARNICVLHNYELNIDFMDNIFTAKIITSKNK